MDTAVRRLAQLRLTIGDELREGRLRGGLSQKRVAQALGCSGATVSRIERGLVPRLTIDLIGRFAAIVGLELRLSLFPIGSPIRDAGQLAVLARLQPHVSDQWRWIVEMLVGPNDLRAFDAGAVQAGCRIGFDVWARVRDVQAQARGSLRKKEDGKIDRLILVFGDTSANRRALRDAGPALVRAFPLGTREILRALREGRDPGADGMVII